MAVVTPNDRPKSVCNCCVIEDFVGVSVLSLCFWSFLWVKVLLSCDWVRFLSFSLQKTTLWDKSQEIWRSRMTNIPKRHKMHSWNYTKTLPTVRLHNGHRPTKGGQLKREYKQVIIYNVLHGFEIMVITTCIHLYLHHMLPIGCTKENQCSCRMDDGSGTVDLSRIGNSDLMPRYKKCFSTTRINPPSPK